MGAHGKVATFQRVFALFDRARLSCRRMSRAAGSPSGARGPGRCSACQAAKRRRAARAMRPGRPVPPPPSPTLHPGAGDTYDPLKKFCSLSFARRALRRLVHGDQGEPGTGVSHRALRCPLKHTAAVLLFVTLPGVVMAQDDSPVSLRLHAGEHGFGAQVRWVVWGPGTPVYTRGTRATPTAYVETGNIIGEMAVVPPAQGVAPAEGEMGPIEPTITEEPIEQDWLSRVGDHLERNAGKYATALASAAAYAVYEYGKSSGDSKAAVAKTQAARDVVLDANRSTLVAKQGAQISVKDAPQTEVPNLVAERDSRIEYDFQRAE